MNPKNQSKEKKGGASAIFDPERLQDRSLRNRPRKKIESQHMPKKKKTKEKNTVVTP